jgi:hypothetical protein
VQDGEVQVKRIPEGTGRVKGGQGVNVPRSINSQLQVPIAALGKGGDRKQHLEAISEGRLDPLEDDPFFAQETTNTVTGFTPTRRSGFTPGDEAPYVIKKGGLSHLYEKTQKEVPVPASEVDDPERPTIGEVQESIIRGQQTIAESAGVPDLPFRSVTIDGRTTESEILKEQEQELREQAAVEAGAEFSASDIRIDIEGRNRVPRVKQDVLQRVRQQQVDTALEGLGFEGVGTGTVRAPQAPETTGEVQATQERQRVSTDLDVEAVEDIGEQRQAVEREQAVVEARTSGAAATASALPNKIERDLEGQTGAELKRGEDFTITREDFGPGPIKSRAEELIQVELTEAGSEEVASAEQPEEFGDFPVLIGARTEGGAAPASRRPGEDAQRLEPLLAEGSGQFQSAAEDVSKAAARFTPLSVAERTVNLQNEVESGELSARQAFEAAVTGERPGPDGEETRVQPGAIERLQRAGGEGSITLFDPFRAAGAIKEGVEFGGFAAQEIAEGRGGRFEPDIREVNLENVNIFTRPGTEVGGVEIPGGEGPLIRGRLFEGGVAGKTERATSAAVTGGLREFERGARERPAETAAFTAGSVVGTALGIGAVSRVSPLAGRGVATVVQPGEEALTFAANRVARRVPGGQRVINKFPNNRIDNEEIILRGANRARKRIQSDVNRAAKRVGASAKAGTEITAGAKRGLSNRTPGIRFDIDPEADLIEIDPLARKQIGLDSAGQLVRTVRETPTTVRQGAGEIPPLVRSSIKTQRQRLGRARDITGDALVTAQEGAVRGTVRGINRVEQLPADTLIVSRRAANRVSAEVDRGLSRAVNEFNRAGAAAEDFGFRAGFRTAKGINRIEEFPGRAVQAGNNALARADAAAFQAGRKTAGVVNRAEQVPAEIAALPARGVRATGRQIRKRRRQLARVEQGAEDVAFDAGRRTATAVNRAEEVPGQIAGLSNRQLNKRRQQLARAQDRAGDIASRARERTAGAVNRVGRIPGDVSDATERFVEASQDRAFSAGLRMAGRVNRAEDKAFIARRRAAGAVNQAKELPGDIADARRRFVEASEQKAFNARRRTAGAVNRAEQLPNDIVDATESFVEASRDRAFSAGLRMAGRVNRAEDKAFVYRLRTGQRVARTKFRLREDLKRAERRVELAGQQFDQALFATRARTADMVNRVKAAPGQIANLRNLTIRVEPTLPTRPTIPESQIRAEFEDELPDLGPRFELETDTSESDPPPDPTRTGTGTDPVILGFEPAREIESRAEARSRAEGRSGQQLIGVEAEQETTPRTETKPSTEIGGRAEVTTPETGEIGFDPFDRPFDGIGTGELSQPDDSGILAPELDGRTDPLTPERELTGIDPRIEAELEPRTFEGIDERLGRRVETEIAPRIEARTDSGADQLTRSGVEGRQRTQIEQAVENELESELEVVVEQEQEVESFLFEDSDDEDDALRFVEGGLGVGRNPIATGTQAVLLFAGFNPGNVADAETALRSDEPGAFEQFLEAAEANQGGEGGAGFDPSGVGAAPDREEPRSGFGGGGGLADAAEAFEDEPSGFDLGGDFDLGGVAEEFENQDNGGFLL